LIGACNLDRMMTNNELEQQIERLVKQQIEAVRNAAAAAVERAFAATRQEERNQPGAVSGPRPVRTRATPAPRRAAEEVVALGERFYAVLCRNPGETMATLAPQVGASPSALQVAVARLKRGNRVRAVGQRQFTRYFPMTNTAVAA